MNKAVVIIGQSASGKTTFVKKYLLPGNCVNTEPAKLIKVHVNSRVLALGHYNIGKRTEGTDVLSYAALPALIEYINEVQNKYRLLIAEGDRINSKKFFQFIKSLDVDTTVYYFKTYVHKSMKRRVASGSKASERFVKSTVTKSANSAAYARALGFNVILKET